MTRLVLVHNVHEKGNQGSVWFLGEEYKGDPSPWYLGEGFLDEHAIKIVGPVDISVAGEVGVRVKAVLKDLGIALRLDETADD